MIDILIHGQNNKYFKKCKAKSLGMYYILRKNALIKKKKKSFSWCCEAKREKTIKVDIWRTSSFRYQLSSTMYDHTSSDRHRLIVDNLIESVIVIVRSTRTVEDIRWSSCGRNRLSKTIDDHRNRLSTISTRHRHRAVGISRTHNANRRLPIVQIRVKIPLIPAIENGNVAKDNSKTTECLV